MSLGDTFPNIALRCAYHHTLVAHDALRIEYGANGVRQAMAGSSTSTAAKSLLVSQTEYLTAKGTSQQSLGLAKAWVFAGTENPVLCSG